MLTLDQFRSNRNVLFWSLHAAGWGAYAITQYFGALTREALKEFQKKAGIVPASSFYGPITRVYVNRLKQ